MKTLIGRKRIWPLILAAGLTYAALPADMRAQERWGEFGLNGMAVNFDRESVVWPGFALNLGAWHKSYALEGYAVFFLYLPVAAGASVIVSPFHTSKVVPYFSAGGLIGGALFSDYALAILNAGVGLKFPFNDYWGIRAEYRFLYYQEEGSRWETGGGVCFGIYTSFGRKTGTRRRH